MENYYTTHEGRFMNEIKMALPYYQRVVADAYGAEFAREIAAETIEGFRALLPEMPYIGGNENPLTTNLTLTAPLMVLYQSLSKRGKTALEAARLIYLGTASMYSNFPFNAILWMRGRREFSNRNLDMTRQRAIRSQERRYPQNWVAEFVPGDGKTFIYGINYTECGILKYLAAHGVSEISPYLCSLDIPMCRAMHVGFSRTETLAKGDARCNFRFFRWGEQPEMKPDFLVS